MKFYEVLVASQRFHGQAALTYSSEQVFKAGAIVVVPLRGQPALGIVVAAVSKPAFAAKAITRLAVDSPLPAASLQLLQWLKEYYPAPLGLTTGLFVPNGLLHKQRETTSTKVDEPTAELSLPPLTSEQAAAVKNILSGAAGSFLLHGDTGSGKTRVYIEVARRILAKGRSVLVLTPEIGLTPQLVQSFAAAFSHQVIVTHSHLTEAERRRVWLQILTSDKPLVVVGPRSALFSPLSSIGLIVVDEAHEAAYKQEQAPRYQSLRVAAKLAKLHGAKLVLGTATPTVSEYYMAQARQVPVLRLTELPVAKKTPPAEVAIVNLRQREQFVRQPHLSDLLLQHLQAVLERGEQALIFLNRRGTARLVLCQNCGWQAVCPRCDLPLTYHGDHHHLRCHTCGYQTEAPLQCQICASPQIVFKSIGTKAVVEALQREFPRARIQRFDTDNLKAERLEQHYPAVLAGDVDILVGTQLLAKGLDLPKLALVGVVIADTSLYFPDYTADEQTYQLLTQVIGRVGRGHRPGVAIIQTYNPDSAALRAVLSKDWLAFYEQQLAERRQFGFPPFYHILKVMVERRSSKSAAEAAKKLAKLISELGLRISLSDAAPSFYEHRGTGYRWQLIVKAKSRSELLRIIPHLPANCIYDLDPSNLL